MCPAVFSEEEILDPLTGFLTPVGLRPRFSELSHQAQVTHQPVCLLLCDLDRMGLVNDRYGWEAGDDLLCGVARAVRRGLRSFELVYRVGGDRFLVVLPGFAVEGGVDVAERSRATVERLCPREVPITMSVGVTAGRGHRVAYRTLLRSAEGALSTAKYLGRNRVCAAPRDGIGPQLTEVLGRGAARIMRGR